MEESTSLILGAERCCMASSVCVLSSVWCWVGLDWSRCACVILYGFLLVCADLAAFVLPCALLGLFQLVSLHLWRLWIGDGFGCSRHAVKTLQLFSRHFVGIAKRYIHIAMSWMFVHYPSVDELARPSTTPQLVNSAADVNLQAEGHERPFARALH